MNTNDNKISVVINTRNSEQHLDKVLQSVKEFDEIVICDMYSTDKTIEIAEKYNCKIVFIEPSPDKIVEPARNFAIQSATHKYVLVLDSDEIITTNLRKYLYDTIQKAKEPVALLITLRTLLMGKLLRHTGYIARFFPREGADWPPVIHSRPSVNATWRKIPRNRKELSIIHLDYGSIEHTLGKYVTYINNEAVRREKKPISLFKMITSTNVRFMKFYIFKLGFLDGKAGYVSARLMSMYKFLTLVRLEEELEKERSKK